MKQLLAAGVLLGLVCVVWAESSPFIRVREAFRERGRTDISSSTDAGPDISGSFELAPADGGGMGIACGGVAITGSAGQTITLTRASSGYCNPYGLATGGIPNSTITDMGIDGFRVMPDDAGVLSLLIESSATNLLTWASYLDDAAWTKTATIASDLDGVTNENFGNSLEDTSAVAAQNAAQTYTTSTTGNYVFSAWLKGGTLTTATLKLISAGPSVTTTCSITGLSTTTWSRHYCQRNIVTSVSSITVEIYPGDSATVADQGTIYADLIQLEAGVEPSSAFYTTSGPATRAGDDYRASGVSFGMTPGVIRAKVQGMTANIATTQVFRTAGSTAGFARLWRSGGTVFAERGDGTINASGPALTADGFLRAIFVGNGAGATVQACKDGTCGSATSGTTTGDTTATVNRIGNFTGGNQINGLLNQLCVDSTTTRCNTY